MNPIAASKNEPIQVNAENVKEQGGETDWREEVTICSEVETCKDRILDLMEPFSTMSLGHLGVIKATQHRIDLVPGVVR